MEASAINTPHPDGEPDEADLFFGGEEPDEATAPAEPEAGPTEPVESAGPTEDPTPASAPEAASAPEPVSSPEPSAQASGPADPPEPEPSGQGSEQSGEADKRGAIDREYIVFHKVPLTEKALRFLLKEIEDGRAPEPRLAYFEIDRVVARNVNGAIGEAYTKSRDSGAIGEEADLAVVSDRSFQQRHVAPKTKVEAAISITP